MMAIYKARSPLAAVPDLPSRVHSIGTREYVSGGRPSTCTRVDPIDTRENVTDDTGASSCTAPASQIEIRAALDSAQHRPDAG